MKKLLTTKEINNFKVDGAVVLRKKFDIYWIEKLKKGIGKDLKSSSPRLVSHTKKTGAPAYFEDYWSWSLFPEFKDFVFNSPTCQIASELLSAKKINLVMDNWFLREAGSKSSAPFHHDISYFDFAGSMCVLWLPLESMKKEEGITWIKGSHLWDKLFLRVRFKDGHKVDGNECIINGKKYENPPDILSNKNKYKFLKWDLEIGDCIMFDMRTLHGSLNLTIPKKTIQRYTLRMAKEDAKIEYRGDWARDERKIMKGAGYKNGDKLDGVMFPQLWPQKKLNEKTIPKSGS